MKVIAFFVLLLNCAFALGAETEVQASSSTTTKANFAANVIDTDGSSEKLLRCRTAYPVGSPTDHEEYHFYATGTGGCCDSVWAAFKGVGMTLRAESFLRSSNSAMAIPRIEVHMTADGNNFRNRVCLNEKTCTLAWEGELDVCRVQAIVKYTTSDGIVTQSEFLMPTY
jgi:hypothetical protein